MADTTVSKVSTEALKTQMKVKDWGKNQKVLYLNEKEWNQYLDEVQPSVKAFWKRNGFPKKVNPETGKEEDCVTYKRMPVFVKI